MHRAKALEPYVAPSWCSNDLSFQRGEELELSTLGGLWWLARNEVGETGIVPADHLVPLWSKVDEEHFKMYRKNEKGVLVGTLMSIQELKKQGTKINESGERNNFDVS